MPTSGPSLLEDKQLVRFKNKGYTLLDFWASWCEPCREQHKKLKGELGNFLSREVDLIGVIIDDQKNKDVCIRYLKNNDIPWKNIFVPKSTMAGSPFSFFHITGYPTYVLIDNDAHQILVKTGRLDEILKLLNAL